MFSTGHLVRRKLAMAVAALSATLMAPLGANAIPEKTVVYHEDVKGLLVTPDNASKSPALILMHDFGGLDEEMRRRARAFAAAGFVALAFTGWKRWRRPPSPTTRPTAISMS